MQPGQIHRALGNYTKKLYTKGRQLSNNIPGLATLQTQRFSTKNSKPELRIMMPDDPASVDDDKLMSLGQEARREDHWPIGYGFTKV